jgi:uncharacterized protein (TIGR02266 family)
VASTETVLVVGFGPDARELSGRLLLAHYRGRSFDTLQEAAGDVRDARAALVHSHLDDEAGLRALAQAGPGGRLPLVASGPQPGKAGLRVLRRAGVRLALFEPFRDPDLRFVLNEAIHDEASSREHVRVPTPLDATAVGGTGEKRVSVYNLSRGGAFLETMRPTPEGGRITLRLPLPASTLEVEASVVTTNVPGNLQRPNLPMGMGVRFENLSEPEARAIADYVNERDAAYRI